ncbi:MAG: hypothetical protein ACR2IK_04240, partial [Chloroflexota bacterium]
SDSLAMRLTSTPSSRCGAGSNLLSLPTCGSDTIDEVASIAEDGMDRIGSDASLCFAFLRHAGLRL